MNRPSFTLLILLWTCAILFAAILRADEVEGRRWALLVGINDYQQVGDLKFCRQDAEGLREVLLERAGFDPDRTVILTGNATRVKELAMESNIRGRIKQFSKLAGPDDTLLVYFAGHGVTLEGRDYLLPVGGQKDPQTAVSVEWVKTRLADSQARSRLLILDVCRPGSSRAVGSIGLDLKANPEVTVLTSCSPGEESHEAGGHGVFTRYLIEGFKGEADRDGDARLTQSELYRYVREELTDWCVKENVTQVPQILPGLEEVGDRPLTRIPRAELKYHRAMESGREAMEQGEWDRAVAAFRRALGVEGYADDHEARGALEKARDGAETHRRKVAYEEAYGRLQTAYRRARGSEQKDRWKEVKSLAQRAIGTGYRDVSGARDLLERAKKHLGPGKEMELDLGGGVTMKLVRIPAGEFMMGSEEGGSDEKPVHRVRITEPFYMGVTEVTQEQYEAVMGENPSRFKGARNPVEQVSWNNAREFCRKLSAKTDKTVRLPTEAQWEYACRAGSTTPFCFGSDIGRLKDYGWFYLNSGDEVLPGGTEWDFEKVLGEWGCQTRGVRQKKPNTWGLYDMHGNVWEWCRDWYDSDYYENSPTADPTGPASGSSRVLRGGSWFLSANYVRSAHRGHHDPTRSGGSGGFRVVLCVSSPE